MKGALLSLAALGVFIPITAWCQPPTVIAIWGSLGYGPGEYSHPSGVAVDPSGFIYVADMANRRVQVLTSGGTFVTQYGSVTTDTLSAPSKVALGGDGTVYVADGFACAISMWRDGAYQGWFGGCGSGPGMWVYSEGVAVGSNRVYVSDTFNHRIQVFTTAGDYMMQWPTADLCQGMAIDDSGHVYVAEYGGHIDVFTTDGTHLSTWGSPGSGPGHLNSPYDVALDAQGRVYVADAYNHRIEVFSRGGVYLTDWGGYGSGPGQFNQPRGVAVDASGRVYVADTWNDRIQVFGPVPTPSEPTTWGHLKALYR